MTAGTDTSRKSSFPRRLSWHILMGISLYWISNAMVVFPWTINKALGIAAMFLSTVLWGFMAYYCLRHAPLKEWNRDTLSMGSCFLVTGVIQDYLLYAVYRGVPDELYEPTTFMAYGMTFFMPFLVRYVFLRKYTSGRVKQVTAAKLLVTATAGIAAFIFTVWSMKYW